MPEVSGRGLMRRMRSVELDALQWVAGGKKAGLGPLATGFDCWGEWAQVAERLMAADCKSAAPWSYGGSNPPLCTMN